MRIKLTEYAAATIDEDAEDQVKKGLQSLARWANFMLPLKELKGKTRKDIVPLYAELIVDQEVYGEFPALVEAVNCRILNKWKPSGLLFIKELAWASLKPPVPPK